MITEVTAIDIGDGVKFEIRDVAEIMDEAEYPGIRVSLESLYEGIRTPLKLDISTGDIITPREIVYGMKLMFEKREIQLLAYNIETVLAEKMETIIARDVSNTRMRDFYDVHILLSLYGEQVDKNYFKEALDKTALKRGSKKLFLEVEEILNDIEDSGYMQRLWISYQNKFNYADDVLWEEIMMSVRNLWDSYKGR